MKISAIIECIEEFAPLAYQENYDNAGLIVGNKNAECTGVLLCLDSIEKVVDEAIEKKINLIVAHHPIVFSGLKKITGKNYIEKIIIKAIKNDIAIYAAHTNLDNVKLGVNQKIAAQLGLQNCKILDPKKNTLKKLFSYIPTAFVEKVQMALFNAGAGNIENYSECSFVTEGIGTFKGNENSNPFIGKKLEKSRVAEIKLEVVFPAYLEHKILQALHENHPYESVAYEIILIENTNPTIGSGMIGELENEMTEIDFLHFLKEKMNTKCIRFSNLLNKPIKKVALCGGAGSFLLNNAISQKADVFITGDFKYHQFFDADNQIIIADIGHFESEQFTIQLFNDILTKKFRNFAVFNTQINTNSINYI